MITFIGNYTVCDMKMRYSFIELSAQMSFAMPAWLRQCLNWFIPVRPSHPGGAGGHLDRDFHRLKFVAQSDSLSDLSSVKDNILMCWGF